MAILLGIDEERLKVEVNFINSYFNYLLALQMPKLWEDPNVESNAKLWVANSYNYFNKNASIELFQKVVVELQTLKSVVDNILARFLTSGRIHKIFIRFKANIYKLQANLVVSRMEVQELENVYGKIKFFLPLDLTSSSSIHPR